MTATAHHEATAAFVDSCCTFQTNIVVHTVSQFVEAPAADSLTVFIVPNPKNRNIGVAPPPYWPPACQDATSHPDAERGFPVCVDGRRMVVAVLPPAASRHNCPLRPDAVTSFVDDAAGRKGYTSVNVVACFAEGSKFAAPFVAAVARAVPRSFNAKGGRAPQGYLERGVPVHVFVDGDQNGDLSTLAFATQLCMRLVDAPTNLLDTVTFTAIAKAYADKLGLGFSAICGEELRARGYGGIFGVGKGAELPPALVTLTYRAKNKGITPKDKLALVGKGIVYDTGGLAIKPREGMCGMKMDMGGAAAVFTGFLALVTQGAPHDIDCVLCLADNAVSALSQRNDDIVVMKSGRTVEINNTDAEGRLVLSDGVFHAVTETGGEPQLVLDMATLTGAQGIATGKLHAGLYTNVDAWETRVMAAGIASGDLCFPLLYAPELHASEFSSKVADTKNSVWNRSNAQSSCAAYFIEANLPSTYKGAFVHIDMASPVARDGGATGYGPALLLELFRQ